MNNNNNNYTSWPCRNIKHRVSFDETGMWPSSSCVCPIMSAKDVILISEES